MNNTITLTKEETSMDLVDSSRGKTETSLTNWSKIHRKVGTKGTYCFGSAHRVFADPEWETEFYRQAWAQRFRVRVEGGVVYLDSLLP